MKPVVLMVTHSGDRFVTDKVAEGLTRRGATAVRIDTDDYPTRLPLEVGLEVGRIGGVDLDDVVGVWRRKVWSARLPEEVPASARRGIQREAQAQLAAFVDVLAVKGVSLVNPVEAENRAEGHKSLQLAVARQVGLAVPPTLITNEPEAVKAFFAAQDGEVVAKMLTPLVTSMEGGGNVPTSVLLAEHLDHLDGLKLGPMCFQRRIHAERELRIAWVDGQVFVGAQVADGVDWRTRGSAWRHAELDPTTKQRLDAFMGHFGLRYGAIDLMLPADGGPPVFLEVNPSGEWGMLERDLGLPIGEALAEALLDDGRTT